MEYVSIEEIPFSVRTYNCLKRYGLNSLTDLQALTNSDKNKIRNLGPKSRKELEDFLAQYEADKYDFLGGIQLIHEYETNGRYQNNVAYSPATRKDYHREEARINEVFKNDLFRAFEVMIAPKREKAFEIAWDLGHSAGLLEVANHFADLVDLIQD